MRDKLRFALGQSLLFLVLAAMPAALAAQGGIITGKVIHSAAGTGIPSVQVTIPTLRVSTLTAGDGTFTLTGVAPGTHEIRVLRIGYTQATRTVTVTAGQVATVEIPMAEAAMALDEIVVTGTVGSARKREVGNSIASVTAADIKQPVQNLDQMLSGRTSGIVLPVGRADMGSGSPIRLRGNASLSLVSYPLIYVDGVRQTSSSYPQSYTGSGGGSYSQVSALSDIDPATIDRVEIVKGPAATALYGTEAAAGVIQIFTKKGTSGRTVWTFQTDQSVRWMKPWGSSKGTYFGTPGMPAGSPGLPLGTMPVAAGTPTAACIDIDTLAIKAHGAASNTGIDPSGCHRPFHDLDPFLQEPHRQRYTLSVSGGSDLVQFFVSGTGEGGGGMLPPDADLRYQFRSNLSFRPSSKLNVDVQSSFNRYHFSQAGYGNATDGIYFQVVRRNLNGPSTFSYVVLDSLFQADINQTNYRSILGATATWQPITGMSHKFAIGYDDARSDQRYVHPFGYVTDRLGTIRKQDWNSRTLSTDYVASQQVSLTPVFKATVSAGGQLVQTNRDSVYLDGRELPGPGPATASSANSVTTAVGQSQVITGGFLGQVMLAFLDRYFVTVGARVDGNSAFGENLGLQTYPKGSASYVVSDEPFWPDAVGTMKLRAAYGWAGRAPGAFDALQTWTAQTYAGGGGTAIIPRNPGNPDLAPERSRELEVGFDYSGLGDRLALDVTYYNRLTSDALLRVSYPPSSGNTTQQFENVGEFSTSGFELGATGKIINGESFGIELNATLATNKSKVLEIGSATIYNVQEGQPAPVVRSSLKVLNGENFEDPVACAATDPGADGRACVERDGFWGPNLPTRILTVAPTIRLPRQITITMRGEYQSGAYYTQGASHFLAQRGPYGSPSCDEVYRYVPWSEYDGPAYYGASAVKRTHPNLQYVNAADRMRCYNRVSSTDLFTWPADFFKMRELTIQAPLPFRLPRMQTTMVTLSLRNFLTRKLNGNRSSDPEVGGNATVDGLTFGVSDAIPAPAEFTFSLRTTF